MRAFLMTLVLALACLSGHAEARLTLLGAGASGGCVAQTAPTGGIIATATLAGSTAASAGDSWTAQDVLSPDCLINGGTFVESTNNGFHVLEITGSNVTYNYLSNTPLSATAYVKQGVGTRDAFIGVTGPTPNFYTAYCIVSPASGTVISEGTNWPGQSAPTCNVTAGPFVGYYKAVMTGAVVTASTGTLTAEIDTSIGTNNGPFAGDGVSSLEYFGYQLKTTCTAIAPPSGGLYTDTTLTDWTANWVAGDVITGATVFSPDCTQDGSTFVESTGTGFHQLYAAEVVHSFATGSVSVTQNVYSYPDVAQDRNIMLQMLDDSFNGRSICLFNSLTGAVINTSGQNGWAAPTCTATAVTGGWWLFSMNEGAVPTSAGGVYPQVYFVPLSVTSITTYFGGSGYAGTAGSGLNLWGASVTSP